MLASDMLGKCGVLWYQLAAEIEAFQLHLVPTTYGEGAASADKAECWTVVLTMVFVIWRELSKVRVDAEIVYCYDNL